MRTNRPSIVRPLACVLTLTLALAACSAPDAALEAPLDLAAGTAATCAARANNTHAKLLACVTLEGVRAHQAALQAIADAHGGTRASGTPGYDASVDYVVDTLEAAGYAVAVQPFQFPTFLELGPTIVEQVAPPPAGPVANTVLSYSGTGDVTANVTALPAPPADATPGCEAADFAGFPAGNVALIGRGACTFAIKATNAYNAGASAVIIYNNAPGTLNGTLGNGFALDIAVTSVTQAIGAQFAATPGLVLRVATNTFRGLATSYNVLAETASGSASNVVVVGAHLDSVDDGPGIQGNGSGVAAVLETAVQMAGVKPRNRVRFAFWGAAEAGLIGSTHYVAGLSSAELGSIALYLDFARIAAPNFVRFVYDGDGSTFGAAGPTGSAAIEGRFGAFYAGRDLAFEPTELTGRSDYAAFSAAGVPFGGIFTGAEGVKTAEQAATYGGTAGTAHDPCYRQACDTYDNVSLEALDQNADAVAYATLQYAMSTSEVNGARGKGNFGRAPVVLPPGPTAAATE